MKVSLRSILPGFQAVLWVALAALQPGCQTAEQPYQDFPPEMARVEPTPAEPTVAPPAVEDHSPTLMEQAPESTPAATPMPLADDQSAATAAGFADVFRVGDVVNVTFSGLSPNQLPKAHEERVKDDGTITLFLIGSVTAAGKNAGDLQRELQKEYDKYYKNLVVTVTALSRIYYVGGEVKRPNAYPYLGQTTVTKAIQAAGDFTDYAKKTKIQVTRTDGTKLEVNFNKVIDNPKLDPPVYPGDKIYVPRRLF